MGEIAFLAVYLLYSCGTAPMILPDEIMIPFWKMIGLLFNALKKWLGAGQSFVSHERGNRFKPAKRQLKKNKKERRRRNET